MLVADLSAVGVGLEPPAVPVDLVARTTDQLPVTERFLQLDRHGLGCPVIGAALVAVVLHERMHLDARRPFASDLDSIEVDATAVTGEHREAERRAVRRFGEDPLGALDLNRATSTVAVRPEREANSASSHCAGEQRPLGKSGYGDGEAAARNPIAEGRQTLRRVAVQNACGEEQ